VSLTSLPIELSAQRAGPGCAPRADSDFAAACAGDASAFERLIREHQARVFSLALRLTGRREDAEELAQDTFMSLHRQIGGLESSTHVRHWLYRTVTHRSIDLLRSRARRPQAHGTDLSMLEVPMEDAADDPLLHRTLRALLLRLPEVPRAVVLLRFQEDLDPQDIAATLDLPLNTVKSHLRRSLEWLRAQDLEMSR
jgi:RNA polymerase sigma-70 factor (ECF subfamily)